MRLSRWLPAVCVLGLLATACSDTDDGSSACERFQFVRENSDCEVTPCEALTCDCSGRNVSFRSCGPAGCVTGANCDEVCGADPEEALECVDAA